MCQDYGLWLNRLYRLDGIEGISKHYKSFENSPTVKPAWRMMARSVPFATSL